MARDGRQGEHLACGGRQGGHGAQNPLQHRSLAAVISGMLAAGFSALDGWG